MTTRQPWMSRRRFVIGLLSLTGGAALGSAVGVRIPLDGLIRRLHRIYVPSHRIHTHFHYLNLDPAGVVAFIRSHDELAGRLSRVKAWSPSVHTRYLMSTDFFQNGADESRVVQFVQLYEPSVTPCANPFAQFE